MRRGNDDEDEVYEEVTCLEERTVAGTRRDAAIMSHASCNKQFHCLRQKFITLIADTAVNNQRPCNKKSHFQSGSYREYLR